MIQKRNRTKFGEFFIVAWQDRTTPVRSLYVTFGVIIAGVPTGASLGPFLPLAGARNLTVCTLQKAHECSGIMSFVSIKGFSDEASSA